MVVPAGREHTGENVGALFDCYERCDPSKNRSWRFRGAARGAVTTTKRPSPIIAPRSRVPMEYLEYFRAATHQIGEHLRTVAISRPFLTSPSAERSVG